MWVEQTLKKMTLREKLGQMLMVPLLRRFHPSESPAYKEILHEVEENHIGGVIIMPARGPLGLRRSQVYPTAVMHERTSAARENPAVGRRGFRIRHANAP